MMRCSRITERLSYRTTMRFVSLLPNVAQSNESLFHFQVANVRQIVTVPSRLESTSLVLALGLDLFLTRVAPSGTFDVLSESFNKAQLVLTIGGLAIAVVVVRPMVARKKLKERWYTHQ